MAGRGGAADRIAAVPREDVAICQVTVSEVEFGLRRSSRSRRRTRLERQWEVIGAELMRVAWDDEVSRVFGEQKARLQSSGRRLNDFDLAIAAHAIAHGMTLVTADAAFARLRLQCENWVV